MRISPICSLLPCLAVLCGTLAAAEKATTFYMVDVGQGNATFIVPPSGQVRK